MGMMGGGSSAGGFDGDIAARYLPPIRGRNGWACQSYGSNLHTSLLSTDPR